MFQINIFENGYCWHIDLPPEALKREDVVKELKERGYDIDKIKRGYSSDGRAPS